MVVVVEVCEEVMLSDTSTLLCIPLSFTLTFMFMSIPAMETFMLMFSPAPSVTSTLVPIPLVVEVGVVVGTVSLI